jgi:N-acetylmuramoyl-L-alanine amidase
MPYSSIVISSGHGLKVRGASGVLDEVDEARNIVDALAPALRERGVTVHTFHDDTSTSQDQNLHTIVAAHNGKTRELDVSVHLNAFEQTSSPRGCEVLYVTQGQLAGELSAAIASVGFIDRGGKKNTGLYFLNNTDMPAVLLEICFVDSTADAAIYHEQSNNIVEALANELGGPLEGEEAPPRPERPPHQDPGRVDIEISGNVVVTVNGVPVT